jgi:hypothetical protein
MFEPKIIVVLHHAIHFLNLSFSNFNSSRRRLALLRPPPFPPPMPILILITNIIIIVIPDSITCPSIASSLSGAATIPLLERERLM